MTYEEEAYVNLRLGLAAGLKTRRPARGFTQLGLARASRALPRWKQAIQRCLSICWSNRCWHSARQDAQVTGPLVTDAALAALAIEHGATLCSTDTDFRRFRGVRLVNPIQAEIAR